MASWLHHLVQRENVSLQFVPTSYQKADILTQGLQAYSHKLAREGLQLRLCNGLVECSSHAFISKKRHSMSISTFASFGLYRLHFHCNVECFLSIVVGVGDNQTLG